MGIEDRDYYRERHNSHRNLRKSEDFRQSSHRQNTSNKSHYTPKKPTKRKTKSISSIIFNPIVILLVVVAFVSFTNYYDTNIDLNNLDFDVVYKGYHDTTVDFVGANGTLVLTNYDNATDPTYDELITFIRNDKTDTISYDYDSFVCADFAARVHNNAEKAGIRAGIVDVTFSDNLEGHALNCFNTTDKGLVFIDCTGDFNNYNRNNCDKLVKLETGKAYIPRPIFTSGMYYESVGTVDTYRLHW